MVIRFLRRWSPWYLRAALDWQMRVIEDELLVYTLDMANTTLDRLHAHAQDALAGSPDPIDRALRRRVEGRTLVIDATEQTP